jgi:hypothetical protein
MFSNHTTRPLKVRSIRHHELHLIMGAQSLEIPEIHGRRFPAAGTFDIHDGDHAFWNKGNTPATIGFHQYRPASAAIPHPGRQLSETGLR